MCIFSGSSSTGAWRPHRLSGRCLCQFHTICAHSQLHPYHHLLLAFSILLHSSALASSTVCVLTPIPHLQRHFDYKHLTCRPGKHICSKFLSSIQTTWPSRSRQPSSKNWHQGDLQAATLFLVQRPRHPNHQGSCPFEEMWACGPGPLAATPYRIARRRHRSTTATTQQSTRACSKTSLLRAESPLTAAPTTHRFQAMLAAADKSSCLAPPVLLCRCWNVPTCRLFAPLGIVTDLSSDPFCPHRHYIARYTNAPDSDSRSCTAYLPASLTLLPREQFVSLSENGYEENQQGARRPRP